MSELFLVRHGQASYGSDNYDELSKLGSEQSRWLGAYWAERDMGFDHLVVGTMQRHRQTLDSVCEGLQQAADRVHEHAGLNEYDFETMTTAYARQNPQDELVKIHQSDPANKKAYYRLLRIVLTAWQRDEVLGVPESWAAFRQRVKEAAAFIQSLTSSGNRVLAISSGGAISTFVGHVLALNDEVVFDLNLQAYNTGVSRCFFNKHKYSLAGFNSIAHLDRPDRINAITYG